MSSRGVPDLEPVLAALRGGYQHQTRKCVHDFAGAHSLSVAELQNILSLEVARHFLAGEMAYEDADEIANVVYAVMVEDAVAHGDGFAFPEPAFSIYEAFDAGEWDRGDGADPVERYTRPALREILSGHHTGRLCGTPGVLPGSHSA